MGGKEIGSTFVLSQNGDRGQLIKREEKSRNKERNRVEFVIFSEK